ncbi:MAG: hypothetical protein RR623_06595 [Bacilli bacterium]
MTKVENKQLTFEEMEAQLFYAYQQKKCKYYCELSFSNSPKIRSISLFIYGNPSDKTDFKYIFYITSNFKSMKKFEAMIEVLNGEEPDWNYE